MQSGRIACRFVPVSTQNFFVTWVKDLACPLLLHEGMTTKTTTHLRCLVRSSMRATLAFVIPSLIFSQAATAEETFEVLQVIDGDTFVARNEFETFKFNILGIDAPELAQDYGNEAREFLREMIEGEIVVPQSGGGTLKSNDKDLPHFLAPIQLARDGSDVGERMVAAGLAWWYPMHAADDRKLPLFELQARREENGIFSVPHPLAPWSFRVNRPNN